MASRGKTNKPLKRKSPDPLRAIIQASDDITSVLTLKHPNDKKLMKLVEVLMDATSTLERQERKFPQAVQDLRDWYIGIPNSPANRLRQRKDLERRFPWLKNDEPVSGADVVQDLRDWYEQS